MGAGMSSHAAGTLTAGPARVRPWLELLRVPNLATVPGDPLVGAVLASAVSGQPVPFRAAAGTAGAALCLYMAGLVLNDLHDLPDDRLRRPERPLPRGVISTRAAWRGFVVLAAAGLAAAGWVSGGTLIAGLGLLALICLYDLRAKSSPTWACLVMGLCRGANVLLGAAAMDRPGPALLPAAAWTLYIGAVTWLSRREDEVQRPGIPVLMPPLAMLAGGAAAWAPCWPLSIPVLAASAGCAILALWPATRLSLGLFRRDAPPALARAAVGRYIGILLPWQAALVVLGGTLPTAGAALALLVLWPASRRLARRFNAS